MKQRCPICTEYIETSPNSENLCINCECTLHCDNNNNLEVIKSGIKLNVFNLVFGMLFMAGFIFILTELANENIQVLYAGLIFLIFPIAAILRAFIYYKKTDYHHSTLGLYKAVRRNKIIHYDMASKFLIFSIISIQFLGLIMILFGLYLMIK